MKCFDAAAHPPRAADPRTFTGDATMARMDGLNESPRVNLYRVRFQPEARTAWHAHSGPQLLLVVEGTCRVQTEGEPVRDVAVGGAIRVDPGERHWHGAGPDGPMTHLALNVEASTEWFDQVTDEEYAGHPASP